MRTNHRLIPVKSDLIHRIRRSICAELASMVDIAPSENKDNTYISIINEADDHLTRLKELISSSQIFPASDIALSEMTIPKALFNRALRIGFYPISANPLHWGHLLVGLSAMANFKLDKVVFIIAGNDPRKPHLAPVNWRHDLTKEILRMFEPLFAYSDIAKNRDLDGETNIFKILSLNPFQKIDAFYIVGTDHYYRFSPNNMDKDTIQKLEENIPRRLYNYNDLMHSISIIFAKRAGGSDHPIHTSLNVGFISALGFPASSAMIRDAFNGSANSDVLALLPYTAYKYILDKGSNVFFHNKSHVQ